MRVLPQILEFPNHTVSAFGNATVLRPSVIAVTDELDDDSMARHSVIVARSSL